jgi:tRNA nucleotidyltransferase (CCA-adding enzyme)
MDVGGKTMPYEKDRKALELLLMEIKGQDILTHGKDILNLIPELIVCANCKHEHPAHIYNVFEHILHVVAGVDEDLSLKLAALLHDIGKPYVKKRYENKVRYWGHEKVSCILGELILKRLGYDEELINDVCCLIKLHDTKIDQTPKSIQETCQQIGQANFERLLKLQVSDISAHEPVYASRLLVYLAKLKEVYAITMEVSK